MGLRRLGDGAAVTAVPAQEIGRGHTADQFLGFLVAQFFLEEQQCALAFALVQHVLDTVVADVGLARLQRLEDLEGLLPVQQLDPVHLQFRGGDPAARVGNHVHQGREGLQVLLVAELQVGRSAGVGTDSDAQGVEHAVPRLKAVFQGFEGPVQQFFQIHSYRLRYGQSRAAMSCQACVRDSR
ncbi:hypothetical protein FQZ97_887110 [compost metagenome]